jgi:DNA-binding HxlR family transcriptional regulator
MFRTKEQRKELCTSCPVAKVANLIGDTWSLLIIRDLENGARRFGELESSLSGVSSRTLTKKLQFLEENKIVERKEYSEKPPRVEYALTANGKKFHEIIDAMRTYGEKYLTK